MEGHKTEPHQMIARLEEVTVPEGGGRLWLKNFHQSRAQYEGNTAGNFGPLDLEAQDPGQLLLAWGAGEIDVPVTHPQGSQKKPER